MAKARKKSTTLKATAGRQLEAAALLGSAGARLTVREAVVRGKPHDNWREDEFAQIALQNVYGANPPKHIKRSAMLKKMNDWLAHDPAWKDSGYGKDGKISLRTMLRALKKVTP
jgi:hypothetical protein